MNQIERCGDCEFDFDQDTCMYTVYLTSGKGKSANIAKSQGKDDDAEPLCNRALAIDDKILGPRHAHVVISLHNGEDSNVNDL